MWCIYLSEIYVCTNACFSRVYIQLLPKPKCAFTPPRFRTRNSDDFLKLQFSKKPKSESNTHVPLAKPAESKEENGMDRVGLCTEIHMMLADAGWMLLVDDDKTMIDGCACLLLVIQ